MFYRICLISQEGFCLPKKVLLMFVNSLLIKNSLLGDLDGQ